MNLESLLSDPELGGAEFIILRKTWTQQAGVPELTDIERIFTFGTVHPAAPDALGRSPEESRHEPLYLIHAAEPLSLGEPGGDTWTAPDELIIGDGAYRVIQVRGWPVNGFWKAWAVKISNE